MLFGISFILFWYGWKFGSPIGMVIVYAGPKIMLTKPLAESLKTIVCKKA